MKISFFSIPIFFFFFGFSSTQVLAFADSFAQIESRVNFQLDNFDLCVDRTVTLSFERELERGRADGDQTGGFDVTGIPAELTCGPNIDSSGAQTPYNQRVIAKANSQVFKPGGSSLHSATQSALFTLFNYSPKPQVVTLFGRSFGSVKAVADPGHFSSALILGQIVADLSTGERLSQDIFELSVNNDGTLLNAQESSFAITLGPSIVNPDDPDRLFPSVAEIQFQAVAETFAVTTDIPEPPLFLGLSTIALAGGTLLRRRKQS